MSFKKCSLVVLSKMVSSKQSGKEESVSTTLADEGALGHVLARYIGRGIARQTWTITDISHKTICRMGEQPEISN